MTKGLADHRRLPTGGSAPSAYVESGGRINGLGRGGNAGGKSAAPLHPPEGIGGGATCVFLDLAV